MMTMTALMVPLIMLLSMSEGKEWCQDDGKNLWLCEGDMVCCKNEVRCCASEEEEAVALATGAIIGIVIGGVLVLGGIIFLACWCCFCYNTARGNMFRAMFGPPVATTHGTAVVAGQTAMMTNIGGPTVHL